MSQKDSKKKLFPVRTTGTSALNRLQLKYKEFFLMQVIWKQQKLVLKISSSPTSDEIMERFFLELKKVMRAYKLNNLNIESNVTVLYHSGKDLRRINTELSKYVRKSSYFAVKFSNCKQIIRNDKMYRNLANLRSFSIEMTEYSGFGDRQLGILLSNITRYMKHVGNLKLRFPNSHVKNIGDERDKRMNYHLKNIRNLSINLQRNGNFSDTGLKHLGLRISRNSKRLNSLLLSLVSCDSISDQGVKEFSRLLGSNLKNLKVIKINFASSQKLRSGSLPSLVMELGVKSASAEELSFNFRRCRDLVLDSTVNEQQLSGDLQNNKNLKRVSLNFEKSSIELNEKSQRVAEALGLLPKSTEELILDFTSCRGMDKAFIEKLGKSLSVHKGNLQKLGIYFEWCQNVSDEFVMEIGKHLSYPLETLKDLSLSFGWSDNVSDECFEQFMLNLNCQSKKLERLSLKFEGYPKITNRGIENLASSLGKSFKNLKSLLLSLRGCQNVDDEGLEYLSSAIKGLSSIQQLSLDFRGCPKLTNKSLEHVSSSRKKSPINSLKLYFSRCNLITEQGVEILSQNLSKNFTELEQVYLDFSNCGNIKSQPSSMNLSSVCKLVLHNEQVQVYDAAIVYPSSKTRKRSEKPKHLCNLI